MNISTFKTMGILITAASFIILAGCTSAENKNYKSQTDLNDRKMELANKYEACVQKSTSEEEQAKCEAMLKGAEALK